MMLSLKILIADDSPTLREVIKLQLQIILKKKNIPVVFQYAGTGEEAEKELQEAFLHDEPIDIVFLDWMMPKMSGYDFLEKIRSIPIYEDRPDVIMLTAETYSDQIQACLQFNVTSYITKPFAPENLEEALEQVLHKRCFKYAV